MEPKHIFDSPFTRAHARLINLKRVHLDAGNHEGLESFAQIQNMVALSPLNPSMHERLLLEYCFYCAVFTGKGC